MIVTALVMLALHAPVSASPRTCRETRSRSRDCADSNGGGGAGGGGGGTVYFSAAMSDEVATPSFYSAMQTAAPGQLTGQYLLVDGDSTLHADASYTLTWNGSPVAQTSKICPNGADCTAIPGDISKDDYIFINKTGTISQVGSMCAAVQISRLTGGAEATFWNIASAAGIGILFHIVDSGGTANLKLLAYNSGGSLVVQRIAAYAGTFEFGRPMVICTTYDLSTATPAISMWIDGVAVTFTTSTDGTFGSYATTGFYGEYTPATLGLVTYGQHWSNQSMTQAEALALSQLMFRHPIAAPTTGQTLTYTRASPYFCGDSGNASLTRLAADQPCLTANGLDGRVPKITMMSNSNPTSDGSASLASGWANGGYATVTYNTTGVSPYRQLDVTTLATNTVPLSILYHNFASPTAGVYTWSCYAKSGSNVRLFLGDYFNGAQQTYCTCGTSSAWSRCSCSLNWNGVGATLTAAVGGGTWASYAGYPTADSTPGQVTADTIDVWGCKFEKSDAVTPLIPVTQGITPLTVVAPALAFSSVAASRPFEVSAVLSVAEQPATTAKALEYGSGSALFMQYASPASASLAPRCELFDGTTTSTATAATTYTLNTAFTSKCKLPSGTATASQCVNATCTTGDALTTSPATITSTGTIFNGASGGSVNTYIKNVCIGSIGACP